MPVQSLHNDSPRALLEDALERLDKEDTDPVVGAAIVLQYQSKEGHTYIEHRSCRIPNRWTFVGLLERVKKEILEDD